MISIVLIGTGNVATHLFNAIGKITAFNIIQVFGRNKEKLKSFTDATDTTSNIALIKEADLYFLAVSDSAIVTVSGWLKEKKGLAVHTSGSVPIDALQTGRNGVFYPLQTFTVGKPVDFSSVPLCIEAENKEDYQLLESLGKSLSRNVSRINFDQRKKLHLSAVWVNNFTNHLFKIAHDICEENDIPFELLHPLISETVDKIRFLSPKKAQTGPAKRNDVATMQHHLEQLDHPLHKKIYQLLSESIKSTYEEKL